MFFCNNNKKIISNEKIVKEKVETAKKIILDLQKDIKEYTIKGFGPFVCAIYDNNNNLVVKTSNTVVNDNCSNNHAEMRAIKMAEEKYGTYDLSPYNLKMYITSEPCMMCIGGILWSGIKEVYYGVPSKRVEKITGFDEGFKNNWFKEFKKRSIVVYGNIESETGEQALKNYVGNGNKIYKPLREK